MTVIGTTIMVVGMMMDMMGTTVATATGELKSSAVLADTHLAPSRIHFPS
ncbi:MAG: hypothetical protein ACRESK_00755 [Gammaproteobacteria bacterium]